MIARFLSLLILLSLVGGCAAQRNAERVDRAVQSYFASDYRGAADTLHPLADKPDEDFVINNLRLGSALLPAYALDDAEAAFLRAWEVINSTGVNAGGRTLGAVLVDEKIKVWKGEPFERAMASFYLGLIYYMRQDYGNARGAFENALFKLREIDPRKEAGGEEAGREVESNFSLASLMLAKSFQRLGRDDLARSNFDYVTRRSPSLSPTAQYQMNQESNLLLVVDYGYGPRKVTDFDGAIVGFGPKPFEEGPIPRMIVQVDGQRMKSADTIFPPIDLLAMAQDRKWQSIDTIRAVKSAVGTGLIVGGAVMGAKGANEEGSRQRTDLMVAGALIGSGLLLKATSQADLRQWEMLPRTTFIVPLKVAPGTHDVTVEFPAARGLRQTWRNLAVPEKGEATYYFRMLPWNAGPYEWPPPAVTMNVEHDERKKTGRR